MDINVLDKNFELLGIVDTYTSLMWCKRYNEVGALDLQIEATNETLALFKEGNYITRNDDETVYRIEAIELDTNEEKDNHLIIGAYDIKKILNQRIVYATENYNTTVENIIRGLIQNNFINPSDLSRAINNFALKDVKGFSDKTRTQITYDNVGEKITELCKAYNYGYKVTLENGIIYFDLYQGVNRSINQTDNPFVIFSPEYDNLVSSKYNLDISEVKNVALVGGEGEGSARKKVEVGSAAGIDRFEIFVDASSVSSEEGTIPASEYLEMLSENGKEQLANTSVLSSFEGVVDTTQYAYKKDFDLGDIVSLENEYGIKVDARIVEIIETWDDTGYTIEPKFEYMEVPETIETVSSEAILTENGIMTLSENGIALLSETATVSNNGIKISELDETTNLENGCCFPVVSDGINKKITFEALENQIDIPTKITDTVGNGHIYYRNWTSQQVLDLDFLSKALAPLPIGSVVLFEVNWHNYQETNGYCAGSSGHIFIVSGSCCAYGYMRHYSNEVIPYNIRWVDSMTADRCSGWYTE